MHDLDTCEVTVEGDELNPEQEGLEVDMARLQHRGIEVSSSDLGVIFTGERPEHTRPRSESSTCPLPSRNLESTLEMGKGSARHGSPRQDEGMQAVPDVLSFQGDRNRAHGDTCLQEGKRPRTLCIRSCSWKAKRVTGWLSRPRCLPLPVALALALPMCPASAT